MSCAAKSAVAPMSLRLESAASLVAIASSTLPICFM